MSLFAELKRRNVFRAATVYVAVAWLLIQVAETTFPAFGLDDGKLRILIVALAIGFVPAVTLAWLFELTPEGIKRDRDLAPGSPLLARTNRLLDRAIVALLALGLTWFAIDKFVLSPAREQARVEEALEQGRAQALAERLGDKSIVVLPFANLSPDPDQAYLADGLAEELLNLLARIPELRVISRTSAFAFRDKNVGLAEIAGQLKVSHVLEGSVRRSGDRIRITAQLIDAGTDSHLWSETYDRTLDDVFAIQDEIAGHVVEALKLELLGAAPKSRRVDPQAYLLFMQARQLLDSGQSEYARIHALLTRSLEIDPDYADAWTGLGWLYGRCVLQAQEEFCRESTPEGNRRLSEEAIDRALAADPDNATAIAYRAWTLAVGDGDWIGAAPQFERALRLDPTRTDVTRPAMIYARNIRRPDVAIRLGEFAIARDPLCSLCWYQLGRAYRDAGDLDRAEQVMRSFAATGRGGWLTIAKIQLEKGDPQAALEAASSFEDQHDPEALQIRAMALHALGQKEESIAAFAQLEHDEAGQNALLLAEAYAWTGDAGRAFDWLERAASRSAGADLRTGPGWFDWTSPLLRPLFDTARGQTILRQFHASDAEFATIRFAFELPGEASEAPDVR